MEEKKSRKYNSEFRKTIKTKISKLTKKHDFIQIYKIINYELDKKLSINRNGIYFNLNLLSDTSIEQILDIFENCDIQINNEHKITYETYNKETYVENFINDHKLTNQEKSLIKKFNQTK